MLAHALAPPVIMMAFGSFLGGQPFFFFHVQQLGHRRWCEGRIHKAEALEESQDFTTPLPRHNVASLSINVAATRQVRRGVT